MNSLVGASYSGSLNNRVASALTCTAVDQECGHASTNLDVPWLSDAPPYTKSLGRRDPEVALTY